MSWQYTRDGVTSLQLAPGLAVELPALAEALGLPFGQPEGTYCGCYDLEAAVLAMP